MAIQIISQSADSRGNLRFAQGDGISEVKNLLNQFRREQAGQTVNLIRRGDIGYARSLGDYIKKGSC